MQGESSWKVALEAAGGARALSTKARRFVRVLSGVASGRGASARLARLHARGHIDAVPSRVQLVVGAVDMFRFWLKDPAPIALAYCADIGRSLPVHLLLRFVDAPASNIDTTGLCSSPEEIASHLLQVVHPNPLYDFQLLDAHDHGLDLLEAELDLVLAGKHGRQSTLDALVEDPRYHTQLAAMLRQFRADPRMGAPERETASAELLRLDATFGQVTTAVAYFNELPTTWTGAALHVLRVRNLPARSVPPTTTPTAKPARRFAARGERAFAMLERFVPADAGCALAKAERATLASLAEVILEGSAVAVSPVEVARNVDRFLYAGRSQRTVACRALLRLVEWLPVTLLGRPLTRLSANERRRVVKQLAEGDGLWWLCSKAKFLVLIGAYGDARGVCGTGFVPVPQRVRFRVKAPSVMEVAS